jgi:hypothetical protein
MFRIPKIAHQPDENSKYSHSFLNHVSKFGFLSIANIPFLLFFEAKITIWTSGAG